MPTKSVFCLVTSRHQAGQIPRRPRTAGLSHHDVSELFPDPETAQDGCTTGEALFTQGESGNRARVASLPGCLQPGSRRIAETRLATASRRSQGRRATGPNPRQPIRRDDPGDCPAQDGTIG